MATYYRILGTLLIALCFSYQTLAAQCTAVFSDLASSPSSGDGIKFENNVKLIGTGTVIDIPIESDGSGASCNTGPCTYSGSRSEPLSLPSFQTTSSSIDVEYSGNSNTRPQGDAEKITLKKNGALTIINNGQISRIKDLVIEQGGDLTLEEGTYWIENADFGKNSQLIINGSENVTIYVQQVKFGQGANINAGGSPQQLVVIAYKKVEYEKNSDSKAILYAQEEIKFDQGAEFTGAMNAPKIELKKNGTFNFDSGGIEQAEFDGTCTGGPPPAAAPVEIMSYSMNSCSFDSSFDDEINSVSAETYQTLNVDTDGQQCQAVSLDGVNSFIDIPDNSLFDLPNGSVSIWFKPSDLTHASSPNKGKMGLLSKDRSNTRTGGNITIWVGDAGDIEVFHEDASTNNTLTTASSLVQENVWNHIVYTWGDEGASLYLNNVLRASEPTFTSGIDSNSVNLAVGANASTFNSSSGSGRQSQLSDFFIGSIDELSIYDGQLDASEINDIYTEAESNCTTCVLPTELVSHWSANRCDSPGSSLVDIVSGHDGDFNNGADFTESGRFCQGIEFDGNNDYVSVSDNNDFDEANGAISLWFWLDELDGNQTLFSKDASGDNAGSIRAEVRGNGRVRVFHETSDNRETEQSSNGTISANQWHHLVYSFGASGSKVYVDGQIVIDNDDYFNGTEANSVEWIFGASADQRSSGDTSDGDLRRFMNGRIDEIKFYRNQPTNQQVVDWYNETSPTCTCSVDELIAYYSFDEVDDDATSVADLSGNNNNASFTSGVNIVTPANNVSCRAIQTSSNTTTEAREFVDTGIDVNDIGATGSITFWYRYDADWDDGQSRMLFDASSANTGKYFYLVKTFDGKLGFGVEDSDDNDVVATTGVLDVTSEEWAHISFIWDLPNDTYRIYLDGTERTLSFSRNDSTGAAIGDLDTLVFGDNRGNEIVNDMTNDAADGLLDEIRIYNYAIDQTQINTDQNAVSPCSSVHHYLIEHPDTAITCGNPSVTIKACANETCDELVTDSSSVSFTPVGSWSAPSATFTGSTIVTLNHKTVGDITLGLDNLQPDAPVQCSDDCIVTYSDVGLELYHVSSNSTDFSNSPFIGESDLAEIGVRALVSDGETCSALINGTRSIDVSYACTASAGVDYSPLSCNRTFANIPLSGSAINSGSVNLSFNGDGEANFTGNTYSDVGEVDLTVSATIDGVSYQASTARLKFIPANILISGDDTTLLAAGEDFNIAITALGANGGVMPGYRPGEFEASVRRTQPTGGSWVDASFNLDATYSLNTSGTESFSSVPVGTFTQTGYSSSSAYMEEIGTYELKVRDSNYLGNIINSNTLALGRFTPAYFGVALANTPELTDSCSANFTYVGQEFGFGIAREPEFVVTAYNAKGQITQNYSDVNWLLRPDENSVSSNFSFIDDSVYSGSLITNDSGDSPLITNANIIDGSANIIVTNSNLSYNKIANPTGASASPFDANIDLFIDSDFFTDSDGICYQSSYPGGCSDFLIDDIQGTEQRYGRLLAQNTFGPETSALVVPLQTEYLLDGNWRISNTDSCTDINLSQSAGDVTLINDPESATDIATQISGLSSSGNITNGQSDALDFRIEPVTVGGENQRGSLIIQFNTSIDANHWSQHLNIDWDGDGDINADDTPSATIHFGPYRGSDKTIFWREEF